MRLHLLLLFLGIGLPVGVSAQTLGEITGEVTDPSGAITPGASVTATNMATNIARVTRTNEAGIYSFPALVPGTYQVKVEAPGFQQRVSGVRCDAPARIEGAEEPNGVLASGSRQLRLASESREPVNRSLTSLNIWVRRLRKPALGRGGLLRRLSGGVSTHQ